MPYIHLFYIYFIHSYAKSKIKIIVNKLNKAATNGRTKKKINSTHSLLCEWMHICMNKWENQFFVSNRYYCCCCVSTIFIICFNYYSLSSNSSQFVFTLWHSIFCWIFIWCTRIFISKKKKGVLIFSEIKSDAYDWIYICI